MEYETNAEIDDYLDDEIYNEDVDYDRTRLQYLNGMRRLDDGIMLLGYLFIFKY